METREWSIYWALTGDPLRTQLSYCRSPSAYPRNGLRLLPAARDDNSGCYINLLQFEQHGGSNSTFYATMSHSVPMQWISKYVMTVAETCGKSFTDMETLSHSQTKRVQILEVRAATVTPLYVQI